MRNKKSLTQGWQTHLGDNIFRWYIADGVALSFDAQGHIVQVSLNQAHD